LKDKNGTLVTQDNGIIDKEWQLPASNSIMNPVFITPDLVQKCIKRLKASGGAGPDNLPSEFYKHRQRFIVFPLSVIFNISLQTGLLPPIWKSAIVTPVCKKGSPSDRANYCPISLTCIACKLLELCVTDGLLTYLMTHNIITRHQHGFLSKKSTIIQLFECNLDWTIAINGRRPVDIVFLDYAKAFDSVVHKKLIHKLSCYGMCEMV